MNKLVILAVFGLAVVACAPTNDGSRAAAVAIPLTSPINDPDAAGREAFWSVRIFHNGAIYDVFSDYCPLNP